MEKLLAILGLQTANKRPMWIWAKSWDFLDRECSDNQLLALGHQDVDPQDVLEISNTDSRAEKGTTLQKLDELYHSVQLSRLHKKLLSVKNVKKLSVWLP